MPVFKHITNTSNWHSKHSPDKEQSTGGDQKLLLGMILIPEISAHDAILLYLELDGRTANNSRTNDFGIWYAYGPHMLKCEIPYI